MMTNRPSTNLQRYNACRRKIIDNSDFVEIVGEYVALREKWSGFVGKCPFCDADGETFYVTFRVFCFCHACKTGGDAITFYQRVAKCTYEVAFRTVAARAGVEVPADVR